MYLGSHSITMDAKGRMAIPARVREMLVADCGGRIVLTANHEDRCLVVYPEPRWQEVLPQIEALPNMNKSVKRLQRLMIGYASPMEMDGNGRVLVPPTLREYASLGKKLILVGQGKSLELWSEESWFASLDESSADEMPQQMQELSL